MAPTKTAETVEAEGIAPAATVRKWINGQAFPSGYALLKIGMRWGAAALCEIMGTDPAVSRRLLERAERRALLLAEIDALDRKPG